MIWPFSRRSTLPDAAPLYAALVAMARDPRWYREAGVADTMDGRFAVLASMVALADHRLGAGSDTARALSPRLTECFVADMDAQLQQAGLGDPTLGKQVRKLVAVLADKTVRLADPEDRDAVRRAIYADGDPDPDSLEKAATFVADVRHRLTEASDDHLTQGEIP